MNSPYFIVDVTPPLRMRFSCSVKDTILAKAYSTSPSGFSMSTGRGDRKNSLPAGD